VTGFARTPHVSAFSTYYIFLYLRYLKEWSTEASAVEAKNFEATALQSGNSRKINVYSDYMGNNYRCLKVNDKTYKFSPSPRHNLHHQLFHIIPEKMKI